MNIAVGSPSRPPVVNADTVHRFTVDEYHRMIEVGLLKEGARIELLDGWIVDKMTLNPPHARAVSELTRLLARCLPNDWPLRIQLPITLQTSEPEPDAALVRPRADRYGKRHPLPPDIFLLIEIADTSLEMDRNFKGPLYAQARIPEYWIINLVESKIEVYSQPRRGKKPAYRHCQEYGRDASVPLIIAEKEIAQIPVRELLPV
jgi:Uma2 family endonuclease